MSYSKRARLDYNLHRNSVCKEIGITINQYNYLRRLGEQLHTIYEMMCNGDGDAEILDWRVDKLTTQVNDYLTKIYPQTKHVIYTHYQTDPRGATLYIDLKAIPENNYNSAHCIY